MTGIVVKQTESDLGAWLGTEWGFISGVMKYESEPIVLEPFQLAFLQNRSRFRWITKARQVGFSFICALEALARCHLRDGHTTVFVSFNQADAIEKILVARQVFEEMPLAYQKRLVTDAKTELAFESSGGGRRLSRIISVPSKAPRGKKGDVLIDELAQRRRRQPCPRRSASRGSVARASSSSSTHCPLKTDASEACPCRCSARSRSTSFPPEARPPIWSSLGLLVEAATEDGMLAVARAELSGLGRSLRSASGNNRPLLCVFVASAYRHPLEL